MDSLFFLPTGPLSIDNVGWAALALLGAVVFGELVLRILRLPRITGYVLLGAALGQAVTQLFTPDILPLLRPFFEFAFGLLLFELGQRVDLGWLRRNPWLIAISLAESILAFLCVGALLYFLDVPVVVALLSAGVAAATGPAVVLGVCKDSSARGPVTERLQLLCALGSCYAFVALGVAYAWQHHAQNASSIELAVLHPLYLMLGSSLLGLVIAYAVLWFPARLKPEHNNQTLAAIALIVFSVALTTALQLSVTVSLLAAGVLSRTLDSRRRLQPMDFGLVGRLALIVVFVSTGALLNPDSLKGAIAPVFALIAARALGKTIGIFTFAKPSGLSYRKASLLAVSMLPMSGAALIWSERTMAIWPSVGAQMAAIVLSALALMELLTPPLLQFALKRADETREAT
ncbi:MAG TPA: cation:proton antiporter [Rhodocyclaceae bacterium]|nr:cation:proton antiporter [Rhodocyclaceae bacterium]